MVVCDVHELHVSNLRQRLNGNMSYALCSFVEELAFCHIKLQYILLLYICIHIYI